MDYSRKVLQMSNKKLQVTSTASQKFRGGLEASMRAFVGPVKGPVGSAIIVGNKGQDPGSQLLY